MIDFSKSKYTAGSFEIFNFTRYEFSCEEIYDKSPKFITNSKLLEIFRNKGILNYNA